MSDTITIQVRVSTHKVGSECHDTIEVDLEDWEGMTDEEKEELCRETMFGMIEWNWEEV